MKTSQELCEQMQRAGIKIAFSQSLRKTKKTNADSYMQVIPLTGCSQDRDQVMIR